MRRLLWTLLLLLPLVGHAGDLEETAVRAFRDIQKRSHANTWEYGGAIIWRNGELYYSAFARTDRKGDSISVTGAINSLLASDILVALYHTHPCLKGYWTGLYSLNDIIVQVYWNVPAFMLDQCTMDVHEFQLGIDKVTDTGRIVTLPNGQKMHLPAGRIVGNLNVN